MDWKRHWLAGSLVLGLGVCGVACSSTLQETSEPATPTNVAKPATESPTQHEYQCTDDEGEPRQCTMNAECCSGFVCSIDPSKSLVTRYCLEG